jgi:hypothetical protein
LQAVTTFNADYAEMNKTIDPGQEEDLKESGVAIVTAMGYIATLMPLVEKYGQSLEEWVEKEARTVYNILLLEYRKSKVSYFYGKIKERAAKANQKK